MASSKDVAKKAGVSQTTVSRVLNAPEQVRPETRDKVLAAIAALNYVPDANARSLVQQKSYSISLISGGLENPFFVDSTTEIINFATRAGYRVNVHFVGRRAGGGASAGIGASRYFMDWRLSARQHLC